MFALRFAGFIIKAALAIGFIVILIASGLFEVAFFRAVFAAFTALMSIFLVFAVWAAESVPSHDRNDDSEFMRKAAWWSLIVFGVGTLSLWMSL
ncbi:hypothetical protein [Cochlodiniinecator piscidefendens]|uniref:hypothetical protein n=1 Tax=Cochlodiniinecator piscidefendens TaxID=2715756 RepID=UPI00140A979E|nr:hypothetical protein [Cochlodiniinecator piscidefendens]